MKCPQILLVAFACLLYNFSLAQKSVMISENSDSRNEIIRCSSMEYNESLMSLYPKMKGIKSVISRIKTSNLTKTSAANELLRIPVVVHVIHSGEAIGIGPNLSDAHVQSQIDVLNQDFRKMVGTRGFNDHPDGADTMIEFYLAREDPDCNPTTGIDRRDFSNISTSWSGPGGNTDEILKPQTIWDPSRYLNIWTVRFSDSSNLGFAQFPGGPEETDGIVIGYDIFGSEDAPGVDVLDSTYNLGRTTTHEVGHYLGLFHTFNGLSCNGEGDNIDDTPQTNRENYGCPDDIPDSCPGGEDDMIENYMDYSDDICMNIFTNGQSAVMRSFLEDPDFRNSLVTSGIADMPLQQLDEDLSIAILDLNEDNCSGEIFPVVEIKNFGNQTVASATIQYSVSNGVVKEFIWSGSLAPNEVTTTDLPTEVVGEGANTYQISLAPDSDDARECNNEDFETFISPESYTEIDSILFTLRTDDFSEEISWEFKDSAGEILYSGDNYTQDNTIFNETFLVESGECYTFSIFDSESDGICCRFGEGFYELSTPDGETIVRGGNYSSSETTTISTTERIVEEPSDITKVRIFPNPSTVNFEIDLVNDDRLPTSYRVFDMRGRLVMDVEVREDQDLIVSTVALEKAMYFLRLFGLEQDVVIPFIKN